MLFVNDISATSNGSCRASSSMCQSGRIIPCILRVASSSLFFLHGLLLMDYFAIYPAEFRSNRRSFFYSHFFCYLLFRQYLSVEIQLRPCPIEPIVVLRYLFRLIGFFHFILRSVSSFYELPRRIVELTTCARIGLFELKVVFAWACKGTGEIAGRDFILQLAELR